MLLAAALWGSSGIFATQLFRLGIPPESVALLRPGVALGLLVIPSLVWRREALRPKAPGLIPILLLGGLATASFQLAYQMAVDSVGLPVAVALVYLAPALVVAAAGPLLGEWPSRAKVLLATVSVGGVWLAVFGARGVVAATNPRGVAWGILAGVSYAAYAIFGRYASPRWGSLATVLYSTFGATLLLLIFVPLAGWHIVLPATSGAWALLVVFALLTIAVATFLFYDGLGRIDVGGASIASTLEPVVATLLATWLLGQSLTSWGWLGLMLVVGGVAGVYGLGETRRTNAQSER